MYKNFHLTSLPIVSCLSTSACNGVVTELHVFVVYSLMYAVPFQSMFNSKHQALICFCGVFCAVTCACICHAGTSLMDKVFVNQELDPYVIEADGTFDVAALQLQPATVVINGSVITPLQVADRSWPIGTEL